MENYTQNYNQPFYAERPMPSMIEATKTCLRKYATFSGRARRSEYWWFFLAQYIVSLALSMLCVLIIIGQTIFWGVNGTLDSHVEEESLDLFLLNPGIWIYALFMLAMIIPSLAVTVRRLHDINKSGWFLLIPFISPLLIFGAIILTIFYHNMWFLIPVFYIVCLAILVIMIIWMATNGKPETNKWGPSPKYYRVEQPVQPEVPTPANTPQE